MSLRDDVERFLTEFKTKAKIYGVVFRDDRGKNQRTLLELDITPVYRLEVINKLSVTDYSDGPVVDTLNKGSDMWVFGTFIKQREIYVKITMGYANRQAICISFHLAERPIIYKFK